ncbi:hypothetical protein BVX95_01795 [archaeon D22]|nr:hypothetical protein BVX95_01795 [archaeon D22]
MKFKIEGRRTMAANDHNLANIVEQLEQFGKAANGDLSVSYGEPNRYRPRMDITYRADNGDILNIHLKILREGAQSYFTDVHVRANGSEMFQRRITNYLNGLNGNMLSVRNESSKYKNNAGSAAVNE